MNYDSILILLLWMQTIITYTTLADSYQEYIMNFLSNLFGNIVCVNVVLNETDSNLISNAETISSYQFKQLI